jgi:hypothetical protein
MYNGVFNTLEEVVTFYNNRGGAGMGILLEPKRCLQTRCT